ncbi:aldehyde dehydrogenase family protein [Cognaticolwellia beringensis]|uniref:Aldehyde dehydrogenase family protein n=1 Tax=Cognaticolwellia beringensis TaxID=1967665 RepID=A0A222G3Q9_9GAMM|nr:aldehyde dehydrogenase family protein [Cognaticolwellia beringensis]ASP46411.1 aldehyde dehydrogenase family protein [Cognaticolwellia beringensis]
MINYQQLFINGDWQSSTSEQYSTVTNPATEQAIASVISGNRDDVNRAVQAAKTAFKSWSSTSGAERAHFLTVLAKKLTEREHELAALISDELGMPRHLALDIQVRGPIQGIISYINYAHLMDDSEQVGNSIIVKEAIGVCALICPWNYPLHQLIGKIAPAIAAGCTMIVKPSVEAPLSAFFLAEICAEIGLPAGVLNIVTGPGREIGDALCTHPDVDMVSFTGSNQVGVSVMKAASDSVKRVCQELGGKSALIITEDADLEAAVKYGVEDIMCNSGQTCTALSRMLIPRSHYEQAITIAKSEAETIVIGSPLDSRSDMGPLVSAHQQQSVLDYIQQGINEGARLVTGGLGKPAGLSTGYYVNATIFADVENTMTIAQEEIFGPVLSIIPYDDIDQAIEIANDSIFGLSGAVWAANKAQAITIAKKIKSGQVFINGAQFNYQAPFGGYKQSGNGREWGEDGLKEFIEIKAMQV